MDVVIATPGRLLDMISRKYIDMNHLRILILDEADRMLDLGFRDEINQVLQGAPTKRQNMLLSATFSKETKQFAYTFMRHPVKVEQNSSVLVAKTVSASFYPVDHKDKPEILSYLINGGSWKKGLVFVRTKKTC